MITELIRVRFWGNPKVHTFRTGGHKYRHGQMVVAKSDRGVAIGMVNSFPFQKVVEADVYAEILRPANEQDLLEDEEQRAHAKKVKLRVIDVVQELALPMVVSHVTFVEDAKKVVIYYTASERVDFRELLKVLSQELKAKVELRQISLWEKEEALGVMGSCGHVSSHYIEGATKRERKRLLTHFR